MKTLPEYCKKTIQDKLSFIAINKNDIERGDKDIKDMTTSLIKSMNSQDNIYVYVKCTVEGIRFTFENNNFTLKFMNDNWVLINKTVKQYLDSEAYENRWHKYDDFTCLNGSPEETNDGNGEPIEETDNKEEDMIADNKEGYKKLIKSKAELDNIEIILETEEDKKLYKMFFSDDDKFKRGRKKMNLESIIYIIFGRQAVNNLLSQGLK